MINEGIKSSHFSKIALLQRPLMNFVIRKLLKIAIARLNGPISLYSLTRQYNIKPILHYL